MIDNERLLKLIEKDAQLSNEEIAVMLGADKAEVQKTIESLEKTGVIKAYRSVIHWEKASVPFATALIEVKVTPQRDTGYDDIAKHISAFSEVESVYLMAGGYDLAVTVTGATMSDVSMFVRKRLATIEGVLSTATHFILTKYKDYNTVMYSEFEEIDERGINFCD